MFSANNLLQNSGAWRLFHRVAKSIRTHFSQA
jgi:hypothetical protein